MSVAQNSALVRFFAALWAVLRDGWADSVPARGDAQTSDGQDGINK